MGTKCAPPYACLYIGYQEQAKLFTQELREYFSNEECILIKEFFKRYMDDGFIFCPIVFQFVSMICILQWSTHSKKQKKLSKIQNPVNWQTS